MLNFLPKCAKRKFTKDSMNVELSIPRCSIQYLVRKGLKYVPRVELHSYGFH